MTNYNLTFNEAIAATLNDEIVSNDENPSIDQRFSRMDGFWEHKSVADSEYEWQRTEFTLKELDAKWRIVPQQKEPHYIAVEPGKAISINVEELVNLPDKVKKMLDEKDSHLILLERRVTDLEEKMERLDGKALIAKADIKTLYGMCENFEEVISFSEDRINRFEAMLKINDKESYGGTE